MIRECQRALAERGLLSVRHGRRAVERFLDSLVALKDHAAQTTPGPEPEHSTEPYSPALLM